MNAPAGSFEDAAEVCRIANALHSALAAEPHRRTLDALLMTFKYLALQNPCCTEGAAVAAARLSTELTAAAAQQHAPADARIH